MLRTLHVANFGVLEDVSAEFPRGLVCLTGETGAGKSLLVDAIKLLLGARADATDVRLGEREALVEAVFDLSDAPAAASAFAAAGHDVGDMEVSLRRAIGADGRGRAWIQGRVATARELRDLAGNLLSVAGQHAFIGLGQPAERLAMLDTHAGLEREVAVCATKVRAWREALATLEGLRARQAERAARQDYLEYVVRQVEGVSPTPGEVEALGTELAVLRGAARLKELAAAVSDAVYEGPTSAFDIAGRALQAAREMARIDPRAATFAARLESAQIELREVAREVAAHADGLSDDPGRLTAAEERLEAIKGLVRRYGGSVEAVLATAQAARAELASLAGASERSEQLAAEVEALHSEASAAAAGLTRERIAAARALSEQVTAAVRQLAMEGATFEARVVPAELGPTGADRVDFLIETNPGEGFGEVADIASGGELSRVTLALYSALSSAVGTPVMVFDEIDAGVSGAVADRMGEVLAQAARTRQVLVVTHHGQVAARASAHFRIEKHTEGGRTSARLIALDDEGRLTEVARMLGGKTVTPRAVAHARELLEQRRQEGVERGTAKYRSS